jgi:hypothetical protein
MSIIQSLNENKLAARYSLLPKNLQGILASQDLHSSVDTIGAAFEIPAENLPYLRAIVGLVFMGFLELDAVVDELRELLGVDEERARAIEDRVYNELFAPYQPDIEAVYLPPDNVRPGENLSPTAPAGPTLNLRVAPASLPAVAMPAALLPKPSMPASGGTAAPSGSAPAPFILQKSTAAEQIVKDSGFRLNLDPKLFGGGPSRPVMPQPPKVARLELGATALPKPQAAQNSPAEPQRIVHYTAPDSVAGIKAAPLPSPAVPLSAPAPAAASPAAPKFQEPAPVPAAASPSSAPPAPQTSPAKPDGSKKLPVLDLRPHQGAGSPQPPAGLPVASAHPAFGELNLKKEDKASAL